MLNISATKLEDAGEYTLLVYNPFGLAISQSADLTVLIPPTLTQMPTNFLARVPPDPAAAPNTNATFSVGVFSRSAVTYQWRSNGVDVLGATGPSITVTNVRTNNLACFTVLISDGASSVETPPACLYPLVSMTLLQGPVPQTVPVGGRVTLSAQYTGWPPPYTNEWRIGATTLVTNIENSSSAFHSFTAPNTVTTQQWRFVVKNLATPGGRASAFASIATTADADGDGLPDNWEAAYGAASGGNLDRLGDADGDGMLNWQEYEAGTNPTNAASYLKIDSISVSNSVRLEFGAISNKTYQIQRTGALEPAQWTSIADIIARATNRTEIIFDLTAPTNRFYRIATPRVP
jgi:hypothetical protein